MGDTTNISWCDSTWNPIRGCSRVSEGCRHCYAERVALRFCGPGQPYEGLADRERGRWTGAVRLVPEHLADPLRWRKPRRIFVNSMSDLFHEKLTNEEIAAVFGVMAAAPQHTFQVLTKRAKRMREWFEWVRAEAFDAGDGGPEYDLALAPHSANELGDGSSEDQERWNDRIANLIGDGWARTAADGGTTRDLPWPLPNVWIGVSTENQETYIERVRELHGVPAAVHFISAEPLLGPIDMRADCINPAWLSWVIAGCESGPGARTCEVAWLRSLRDQCASAGVPFFLKQAAGPERNGIGGSRHMVPIARVRDGSFGAIAAGIASKAKGGGVIELPYLDGVQHAAFPKVSP